MKPFAILLVSLVVIGCGSNDASPKSKSEVIGGAPGVAPLVYPTESSPSAGSSLDESPHHIQQRIVGDMRKGYFMQVPNYKPLPSDIVRRAEWSRVTDLAIKARDSGDLAKAQEMLEKFLTSYPESSFALDDLAPIYLERGMYGEAVEAYGKLVHPPDRHVTTMSLNPVVLCNYGEALMKVNRWQEAQKSFEDAIAHGKFKAGSALPDAFISGVDLVSQRAAANVAAGIKLFFTAGNYSKTQAIEHLKRAVTIKADYDAAHFYLGDFLANPNVRRYEEALPHLRMAAASKDSSIRSCARSSLEIAQWGIEAEKRK